jgi:hypothetical protein
MKRLDIISAAIVLIGTTLAIAGEEKVVLPAYQTHVLYDGISPTSKRFGKPS